MTDLINEDNIINYKNKTFKDKEKRNRKFGDKEKGNRKFDDKKWKWSDKEKGKMFGDKEMGIKEMFDKEKVRKMFDDKERENMETDDDEEEDNMETDDEEIEDKMFDDKEEEIMEKGFTKSTTGRAMRKKISSLRSRVRGGGNQFLVHNVRFYDFVPKAIQCMSYEENSRRLAVARADGSIEIWNCVERPFMQNVLPYDDESSVEGLVWIDGRLFSAGLHGFILEHNLVTGEIISRTAVTGGPTWCIALSPDKKKLAAGTEEGYVCLFDVLDGNIMYDKTLERQDGRILHLAWHCSGDFIVTGSINFIRLWCLKTGRVTRCSIPHHKREEVIVWCVGILDDMTIVSGDSRGKTCFWNGQLGMITHSVTTHRSNILCLVITPDQKNVYLGGVDPLIVGVSYVRMNEEGSQAKNYTWIKGLIRHYHSHDIRALVLTPDEKLYSGGVDTVLTVSYVPRTVIKLYANPPRGSISVAGAASCMLLRYSDRLELWRLGNTTILIGKRRHKWREAKILPITEDRAKLLELRSKQGRIIDWCAVSQNGLWIAYIVSFSLRICQFCPPISGDQAGVRRVRGLSKDILPSYQAVWLQDGKLASASTTGVIQVISVSEIEASVEKELYLGENPCVVHMTPSSDGQSLVVADINNQITVFNIETEEKYTLPRYNCPITAVGIHPTERVVVVAYSDIMIKEISLDTRQYTAFTRRNLTVPDLCLQKKKGLVIRNITFDTRDPNLVLMHGNEFIVIMNKSKEELTVSQSNEAEVDGENQSLVASDTTPKGKDELDQSNPGETKGIEFPDNPGELRGIQSPHNLGEAKGVKSPYNPGEARGSIQSPHNPKARSNQSPNNPGETRDIQSPNNPRARSVQSPKINGFTAKTKTPAGEDNESQSMDTSNPTPGDKDEDKLSNQPKTAKTEGNIQTSNTTDNASKLNDGGIFSIVSRTNQILHFAHVKDEAVVSVELNHLQLQDKLPPTLLLKKYGTR